MIVMKFGGSSVESAAAIRRVAGIVQARLDQRPVVVVSAMGKTTNKLLAIASTSALMVLPAMNRFSIFAERKHPAGIS